ncbi:DinB family protein [Tunicatimonas pelagia]|uniref:DinB family protein n=1 Tax=Tunicatimonas pelagia TaxID=931531 RepID=UPI002667129F|nr:DinB family protein [Tunicatimonas pelagia]WKN43403.1 DinB family protein [Tunicatimonas pelagia]
MNRTYTNALANQFEAIYEGEPWLDETFAKKLNGLTETQAFTRPSSNLRSVAEIISHLIAWRNDVLHRLQGNPRQVSMESSTNWPDREELQSVGWRTLKLQLAENQESLLALLRANDDEFLNQVDEHSSENETFGYLIEGLLHHDCYHLGQIGLIIKLLPT